MFRFAADILDEWLQDKNRKPVVLRGARQVGKTWLVRDLAKRHRLNLVELNIERFPNLAVLGFQFAFSEFFSVFQRLFPF